MSHISLSGQWLYVNQKICDIVGYSKDELFKLTFQDITHPDDLEVDLALVEKMLRGEIQTYSLEKRYIKKNGSHIWINLTVSLVRDSGGSPLYFISVIEDIQQRKNVEMELIEHKLKSAANSKMNAIGHMASGIAHEINNPLTIVYGQAKTLKKMIEANQIDGEKLLSITNSMDKMCDRIVRIINGLRTFSRDAASDPFDFCSVQKILQETLSLCQGRMRVLGIELMVDEVSDEYEFFGRSVQISQVLLNLIDNAIDAVKTVEKKRIHIKFISDSKRSGFAVIDNGPGVKRDHISNLFTPFFTTKEVGLGTGLGLSIAKGIIEAHGGSISLESASKETCFTFYLPQVSS